MDRSYVAVVLYGLVVLFASFPQLVALISVTLRSMEFEAILVSMLLFPDVNFIWLVFVEPTDERVA